MTSHAPCRLAVSLASALAACHASSPAASGSAGAAPVATWELAWRGDADSDQAVDAEGRLLAYTGAPLGDGADAARRPLRVASLAGAAAGGADANVAVVADHVAAAAQLGPWRGTRLAFSPDAAWLATAAPVQLVPMDRPQEARELPAASACHAYALAFGADGGALAAACGSGVFRVWPLGDLAAAPEEVALTPAALGRGDLRSASLAATESGGWRLVVAGDAAAPEVFDIVGGQASRWDLATLGLAGSGLPPVAAPAVAMNPQAPTYFLLVGGDAASFPPRLLLARQPFSIAAVAALPAGAQGVTSAKYSPDGRFALADVTSSAAAPRGASGGATASTRPVVWDLPASEVVFRTGDDAALLTGNTMSRDGRLFARLAPAGDGAAVVGVWQL